MYGHRWAAWRSSCEFRFATPLPRSQVALAFSSPILRPTAMSLAAAADGTLRRAFADRSNDDGGDEGSGGSKIGIASPRSPRQRLRRRARVFAAVHSRPSRRPGWVPRCNRPTGWYESHAGAPPRSEHSVKNHYRPSEISPSVTLKRQLLAERPQSIVEARGGQGALH
jgi:hypothetical protein